MRALAFATLLAALAAPAAGSVKVVAACPRATSFGTLTFARGGHEHKVSLADCTDHVVGKAKPAPARPDIRSSSGRDASVRIGNWRSANGSQSILVDGKAAYTLREHYGDPGPIVLIGWSPDSRWLLFAVDPMGSASIMADGLELQILNVATRRVGNITRLLRYPDYVTWCGSTLVLTSGGDRIATNNKRLVTATAPVWRPTVLWSDPMRAFGSVACAPDGKSVAVLSQRNSTDARFFDTRWRLWQVGLDGSRHLLDTPPPGSADESPWWSRDGHSLLFVRERRGYGEAMLLRDSTATGPVANLGYGLGYYGHHVWWLGATWSAGA